MDGEKGEAGVTYSYTYARPGDRGEPGLDGFKGEQGDQGAPGYIGAAGMRGVIGYRGDVGEVGYQGPDGVQGQRGDMGEIGLTGRVGLRGAPGPPGDPAPPPPPPKSRGFIFTRHSQSVRIPECPANTNKMWEGYSLSGNVASSRAVGQDLGQSGSCLMRFTTMPYMFCDFNNVCNYAQNNDDSLWLSTAEPMPMTMDPIQSKDLIKYISR